MLCSRLLKAVRHRGGNSHDGAEAAEANERSHHDQTLPVWWRVSEGAYDRMVDGYKWTLQWVLEHRLFTVLASGLLAILTAYFFYIIPKGFIPTDDTSQIVSYTEAAQGISFPEMSRHQQALVDVIRTDPNVSGVLSTVGASDVSAASNTRNILILLKPMNQRKLNVDEVIEALRNKVNSVPGISIYL